MTTAAPAATAPAATPSQDDRTLAAVAHLSFLAGFWLVAPIAIYVVKRKESRFVSLYALQAAFVQILAGVGTAFFVAICVVLMAAIGISGRQELAAIAALVPIFGVLSGGASVLAVHLYAAFRAWQGKDLSIPIAGHLARAIMNADEGAVKG
jgi:uncharacterized Tic20 family protein